MTMETNLRPGIFSTYQTAPAQGGGSYGQYAAVCAQSREGEAGRAYPIQSLEGLEAVFTQGNLYAAARLLLEYGVAKVICVPVNAGGGSDDADGPEAEEAQAGEEPDQAAELTAYEAAFRAVEELEGVGALLCDSTREEVHRAMLESVERSCGSQRERVALAGAGDPKLAAEQARALNSERFCLCAPDCLWREHRGSFLAACSLAGLLLTRPVTAHLAGAACGGLSLAGDNLREEDVQRLLAGGVTVFETVNGGVECIRPVTTRTTTGGVEDPSFRSISTVRTIDQVMQRARAALKGLLKGSSGKGMLESVVSQMAVMLDQAALEGLVTSFGVPKASLRKDDPSVCLVELDFTPATALNQIHITAHVTL